VSDSAKILTDNAATGTGFVNLGAGYTVSVSTTYTFSVFAKADQLSWMTLWLGGWTVFPNSHAYFDLANGVVGTVEDAAISANIEDFGNGWYRCSVTATSDSSDTSILNRIYVANADGDVIVDLDGTSSILIYGAQLEEGSTPSSYIPTSGATVTRSAETLTIAAADLPYSSTAMSIQMRSAETLTIAAADLPYSSTAMSIQMDGVQNIVSDAPARSGRYINWEFGDDIRIEQFSTDNVRFILDARNAGAADAYFVQTATGTLSTGINAPFNLAGRFGSTFLNGALDGTSQTASTDPTVLPDLESVDMEICQAFIGNIGKLRMWDTDLGDTGIEEASS